MAVSGSPGAAGSWRLGSVRRLLLFIALVGLWDKAMVTVYLCGISVVIACLIGIPIGIWPRSTNGSGAWCRWSSTRCRPCPRLSI